MVIAFLVLTLFLGSPVAAQEARLLDLLVAKEVISKSDALKVQSGDKGEDGYDQQALIGLLRSKGILDEKDLAQLQVPSSIVAAPATPPSMPQDLTERVTRLEEEANKKPPFTAGYENGFFLRSADGNFSMRVGGRASMHALYQQEDTSQNSTFFIDRARAYMDGWGSWELAARYEYFVLDNAADGKPGALERNRYDAGRIGVNWYLNPWTRVSIEYLHSFFEDAKRSPRVGHHSVNSILSRVQVEF